MAKHVNYQDTVDLKFLQKILIAKIERGLKSSIVAISKAVNSL